MKYFRNIVIIYTPALNDYIPIGVVLTEDLWHYLLIFDFEKQKLFEEVEVIIKNKN